ncbi:MAG: tetratricopeptide repeat protein, partial [Deltaproteobacteria bacterium]|nr:tetratricopeptide repeat protein [Deltaproteobacteria bacterium]
EALRLDPDDASVHCSLGTALLNKRDLDGALAELREALRLDPGYALAHYGLGAALGEKGDFRGSVEAHRKSVSLAPGTPFIRRALAEAERMLAAHARLPAVLRGEDRPATAEEWKALAQVCRRLKDYAAAARFWRQAFEASPTLAADLAWGNRYSAALSAVLAGTAEWRTQAAAWLRADLALRAEQVHGRPLTSHSLQKSDGYVYQAEGMAAAGALRHWLGDPDLASIRGEAELAKLPEAEREEWRAFWRDVAALLAEASK